MTNYEHFVTKGIHRNLRSPRSAEEAFNYSSYYSGISGPESAGSGTSNVAIEAFSLGLIVGAAIIGALTLIFC